jgi:DNA-directed RNA polymerase alpha subunit
METDGSIEPEQAIKNAAEILIDHFKVLSEIVIPEPGEVTKKKLSKAKKK